MATETQNYGFQKDASTDFYSVDTVNENLDKIDSEIKNVDDKVDKKANQSDLNQLSNPNLIVDSDFQLWPSGITIKSRYGSTYLMDKWMSNQVIENGATYTKVASGLQITSDVGNSSAGIQQNIETGYKFHGKNVTLSASVNGVLFSHTFMLPDNNYSQYWVTDKVLLQVSTDSSKNILGVIISLVGENVSNVINWVKLELGSLATPFVPKSLMQEYIDGNNISNPNLLINGDFQVWQRGTLLSIDGSTEAYLADRWQCLLQNVIGTVEKTNNGIKITRATNKGGGVSRITYRMENIDFQKIAGKTITLTMNKVNSNVTSSLIIYTNLGVLTSIASNSSESQTYATALVPSGITDFQIFIQFSDVGYIEINNVKLELGSVTTPFVPRLYIEELAMCQRYYLAGTELTSGDGWLTGERNNGAGIMVEINIPTVLRIKPTLVNSLKGAIQLYDDTNTWVTLTANTIVLFYDKCTIHYNAPSNTAYGKTYLLRRQPSLDAEL